MKTVVLSCVLMKMHVRGEGQEKQSERQAFDSYINCELLLEEEYRRLAMKTSSVASMQGGDGKKVCERAHSQRMCEGV